jgi:hypothetical protein
MDTLVTLSTPRHVWTNTRCLIASLAALAAYDGSLRSLRCSPGATVFVGSDETIGTQNQLSFDASRRLILQIGGANIAGADRALQPAYFVVARGQNSLSPPSPHIARCTR